ncbi:hypothetical protein ROS217_20092 [Roseovarius sp. 217]|nr:hypothetical protein ROS217_20092 [Roseovarius sp. 217]
MRAVMTPHASNAASALRALPPQETGAPMRKLSCKTMKDFLCA